LTAALYYYNKFGIIAFQGGFRTEMPKRYVTEYGLKPANEKDWTVPWELLRDGKIEEGLAILRREFDQFPAPGETLSLGVGYMWAGRYELAAQHFNEAAHSKRTRPVRNSSGSEGQQSGASKTIALRYGYGRRD
jgi:hypothetical protein